MCDAGVIWDISSDEPTTRLSFDAAIKDEPARMRSHIAMLEEKILALCEHLGLDVRVEPERLVVVSRDQPSLDKAKRAK